MKQTAVEWLEQQLFNKRGALNKSDIDKAKAMEKNQIVEAYNTSFLLRYEPYSTAEKYYKQTYESNT
jgi:hypothetical protein